MADAVRARGRLLPGVLLFAYLALIFTLSHQSRPPLPDALLALSDKVLHGCEYLALGFLAAWFLSPDAPRLGWAAWGFAVLYGASDELHQWFIPGRVASVLDVAADAVGAALGVWAYSCWGALLTRWRRRELPAPPLPRS